MAGVHEGVGSIHDWITALEVSTHSLEIQLKQ